MTTATLPKTHPTAIAFLDETGIIAHDRFFSVGLLTVGDAPELLRTIQKIRDRRHWYTELKWIDVTRASASIYEELIDAVAASDARFACFVADRDIADPVARFGDPWRAYQKLATQLLIGACFPGELVSVLADNYSTPDRVHFERDVRNEVNERLGHLVITTMCRLDSRSSDGLQLADILTGGVTFEFRRNAGLAGQTTAKAQLASALRERYSVSSFLSGYRRTKINVAVYKHRTVPSTVTPGTGVSDSG
jgi:hypothetical protein